MRPWRGLGPRRSRHLDDVCVVTSGAFARYDEKLSTNSRASAKPMRAVGARACRPGVAYSIIDVRGVIRDILFTIQSNTRPPSAIPPRGA